MRLKVLILIAILALVLGGATLVSHVLADQNNSTQHQSVSASDNDQETNDDNQNDDPDGPNGPQDPGGIEVDDNTGR